MPFNRKLHYVESLASETGASGSILSKGKLVATVDTGATYLVVVHCEVGNLSGAAFSVELFDTFAVAAVDLSSQDFSPVSGTDMYSCPMMFEFTPLEVGPNNLNFELVATPTSGQMVMRNVTIAAFLLSPLDDVASGTGNTSSTTFVPLVTLPLTVAEDGDYIVRAGCRGTKGDTNGYAIQLTANGSSYSIGNFDTTSTTEGWPWSATILLSLTAGNYDITIDGKIDSGTALTIDNATIVALRVSEFANTYFEEVRAGATIASVVPTYTTKTTMTETTEPKTHLVFVDALGTQENAARTIHIKAQVDGVDVANARNTTHAGSDEFAFSGMRLVMLTGASHTLTIQGAKEVGTGRFTLSDASIAVLQMSACTLALLGGKMLGGKAL